MPDSELSQLAAYAAGLRLADLPEQVIAQARRVVLDTAGAIVAGHAEPEMQALTAELATGGPARVLGTAACADAPNVAMLNAMAGCWQELDEGNRFARGHPGIHVVPAALAVGEATGASGTAVLEAIIAGYEVAARIGRATILRPELHPHGVIGALGAAVAAARLQGANAAGILQAMEIAGALLIAPPYGAAFEGDTVRNAFTGIGTMHGVLAAGMARAGITGVTGWTGRSLGTVLGTSWDSAAMLAGLGEQFEIARNYFKPFASCRHTHGALDLMLQLRASRPFTADEVEQIEVVTYGSAASLDAPAADTALGARFSVPMLLGLALRNGADLQHLPPDTLADPAVRDLARQVHMTLDPEAERVYPDERRTRLVVRLRDGRMLEADSTAVTGDAECPLDDLTLEAKFLSLTGPVLGTGSGRALAIWRALDQADVRAAAALLVP